MNENMDMKTQVGAQGEKNERELTLIERQTLLNEYEKIAEDYEKFMSNNVEELKEWKKENEIARRHLGNYETAFSNLIQKYDRSKCIIEDFKANEEALQQQLCVYKDAMQRNEDKYNELKSQAMEQINKCNKVIVDDRFAYETELTKLKAIVKRQEIKIESLNTALDQKNKECSSLAALLDGITKTM